MPKLFDISDWAEQPWWNTGGTRNKKIYLSPDGDLYFFKQSLEKEGKDYKYEFWSEIIASEIGELCGFNILPYHLAVKGDEVGCISKSMIKSGDEELIEAGKYLQAFDTTFNPDDRKMRHQYNIELIAATLQFFKLERYFKDFSEILVFDSLIGNSDRHQENWALISVHNSISKSISSVEQMIELDRWDELPSWTRAFVKKIYTLKDKMRPEFKRLRLSSPRDIKFAPIYDSGCSFARELSHERINLMLTDEKALDTYINKGLSEIHWGNEKVTHFTLLEHLLKQADFKEYIISILMKIRERFNESKIIELINEVDVLLPYSCVDLKIPEDRKKLICKLVLSRYKRLMTLI